MVRSLSFIHLFAILAVGYIGGALLSREISVASMEKFIVFYDARVVRGPESGFLRPIATSVLFFVGAYVLSMFPKMRFTILFVGAVKSVLFGMSSSFLLSSGMKMIDYTVWWFPFQLLTCYLFLLYCAVLSPPYFMRTTVGKKRNPRAIPVLIGLSAVLLAVEMLVFFLLLN